MTKLDAGLIISLPASDPGSAAVWGSKRINPRPQFCLCLAWSGCPSNDDDDDDGFIPGDCLITDIVSILRCKNKDATNVSNYRSIAVATTITKFFKHFMLFNMKAFFSISDHQFGFKHGTGTDTTITKFFKHFILFNMKAFFSISYHQFGFKRGTGIDIFLLKQITSLYLQQGSPSFSVFLDASKAFDRVSHEFLFKKLLLHDVPPCFIRLLRYWYRQQQT